MGRIGLFVVGAALVTACGSKSRPEVKPLPVVTPADVVAGPPVTPACGPPAQVAVVQVSEDSDESRMAVVEVATGQLLWQGPTGSGGEGEPLWSGDGRFLVYQLEGRLLVHEDGRPDRQVYPVVTAAEATDDDDAGDAGEIMAVAVAAARLAVVADDDAGVHIVDLNKSGAAASRTIALECVPEQLSWSPDGRELVAFCSDEEPNLISIDVISGKTSASTVAEVQKLLGWRGQPPELIVDVDGIPHLVKDKARGKISALRVVDEEGLLELGGYVAGADRFLQVVALDEPGYAQVVWLSEIGDQPPKPWLRSTSTDFGFSGDGGWAMFTAIDQEMGADDWGDIYLARVGRSKVERVLTAPVQAAEEDDSDDDAAGAGAELPLLGFRAPRPRPMRRDCKIAVPAARVTLVEEERIDLEELDAELLPGGAVIIDDQDGGQLLATLFDRIPLDADRMGDIQSATLLDNGNIAIMAEGSNQITVWVVGPTGQELWDVVAPTTDAVFRQRDGGLAILAGSEVHFYDPEGVLLGKSVSKSAIENVRPQADGSSMIVHDSGDMTIVDRAGKELLTLQVDEQLFDASVMADGTIVRGFEADDAYLVGFFDRNGKRLGQYDLGDNEIAMTPLALPNNTLAITLEAESPSLIFLDSRGRVTGEFALGEYGGGAEPAVFDDGSLVVASNSNLYVVGGNGEYQGGRVMKSAVVMGPFVAGPRHVVVMTDEAILFLRRERR